MRFDFFITLLVLLSYPIAHLDAQENLSLQYHSKVVIPKDFKIDNTTVGGLSGISYHINDGAYYIVADKHPSRFYKAIIDANNGLKVDIQSVMELRPQLLAESELEGIAINNTTRAIYVSDEQSKGTRIFEIDESGKFIKIIEPLNSPFLSLSGHNSGIEGLTISNDGRYLYYAFERPTEDCLEESYVVITQVELTNRQNNISYHYQLHEVEGDNINTNGISEILYLNDSSLLVMERAYIPGQGNVVRLYQTKLSIAEKDKDSSCGNSSVYKTKSQLVFDFADVKEFEIDNAEGMTFNADKSLLVIVTDNNFSKRQETQIILLEVASEN